MATPERTTLAERMALASARAAEAHHANLGGVVVAARPQLVHPAPPRAAVPIPRAHRWRLRATPGEQIVLMPGQMYVGREAETAHTLLGSCVAVTLWHPQQLIGGMCHFLLPTRQRKPGDELDGRFGDEALDAMVAEVRRLGTEPSEYVAHLYGGADTLPEGAGVKFNIGERNIEQGWTLIDKHGFQLQGVDVGEDVPRTVKLTLATGDVDMRRGGGRAAPPALPGTPGWRN